MSQFHLCSFENCNKKYKTVEKYKKHLLEIHQKLVEDNASFIPEEITKENKKSIESKRNKASKEEKEKEKEKLLKEEILKQKELEALAKEQERLASLERYRALERDKLLQEELEVKLKKQALKNTQEHLLFEEQCLTNLKESKEGQECCICSVEPRDTAVFPCAHKYFCYACIISYKQKYPNKGCPVCREPIKEIKRIYG